MRAALRWTMNAVVFAILLAAIALGLAWQADRTHRWEAPAWRDRSFVRLRGGAVPPEEPGGRWVMAVHLGCGHCLATLGRTQAAWTERGWRPELTALLVDTPTRLGPAALRAIPTSQVWWDARGIWRRRWGHRIYGEVLQFDRFGRHVRTVTAETILRRTRLPEPDPANHDPDGGEP